MRTFIGVELDTSVKEAIKSIQNRIRQSSVKGRFKHVDNFHITIKFLGEISNKDILQIDEILNKAALSNRAFELKIDKLGYFGKEESMRVLWLGLGTGLNNLRILYKSVEEGLAKKGFKKDNRAYTPHITVAQDLTLLKGFNVLRDDIDLNIIPDIGVKAVSLIKSEQIRGHRVYTPISTFKLKEL